MISSAFKVPTELFTSKIQLFPHAPTLENFRTSIVDYSFFTWLLNSIGTTLGISVGQMIVAILAAFALCFFKTKYNEFIFYFLLSTIVIPFQVTMIPNYILISKAGLLNTWMAVILPNIASGLDILFFCGSTFGECRRFSTKWRSSRGPTRSGF
jgi:ABC-type sugar transport system, permease component